MKADKTLLQLKYVNVIETLAKKLQIPLRDAMTLFYSSFIYNEMAGGISDTHCRSDVNLADEIITGNKKTLLTLN